MPNPTEALYTELEALTQELETMRTAFLADQVLDPSEKEHLDAMRNLIEQTQQEIAQLQAPVSTPALAPEILASLSQKIQELQTLEQNIQQFLAQNPFSFNTSLS